MTQNDVQEVSGKRVKEILQKKCVLIDFFAEWNMPCLMMAPVIEELAEKFRGKIEFARINIDENNEFSKKLKVMALPTIILFMNGVEAARLTGSVSQEQIEKKISVFVE